MSSAASDFEARLAQEAATVAASAEEGEGPPAIAELLASWTDLDSLTDVTDYRGPEDGNPHTQWTLRDVKALFENPNSEFGNVILCPRLPCQFEPRFAQEANLARHNNVELARYIRSDPMWLARRILGKRGLVYQFEPEFDTWLAVEQGIVIVSWQRDNIPGLDSLLKLTLEWGHHMIFPKTMGTLTLIYVVDSLATLGNIVPSPPSN